MNRFVVGFLFSGDRKKVVLIHKLKPLWQKNKLNGIGGKMVEGESPLDAMSREFLEEAGVEILDWEYVLKYYNEGSYEVFFFRHFSDDIYKTTQQEEEPLRIIPISTLPSNTVFNLRWLIPLCLDHYVRPPFEMKGG